VSDISKIAIVTGGASGLGRAIAIRLAKDGARCICVDRAEDVEKKTSDLASTGLKLEAIRADVANAEAIVELVGDVVSRHGRVDVLVNCAGTAVAGRRGAATIEETTLKDWERTFAVNLTAAFLLSRECLPHMKRTGWGRIVKISSRAGRTHFVPSSGAAYSASKAGLIGLTRVIAAEAAPFGITANSVAPGRFDTPMANRATREAIQLAVSAIPLGRIGQPDEIAATVAFLVSEGAAYITGANIDVNGGAFMG
jgi:3-oxoacyl-[acyl-carrier protein] reductase